MSQQKMTEMFQRKKTETVELSLFGES